MIPNVSAIEYKTVVETNQLEFNNEFKLLEKTLNNIENRFEKIIDSILNVDIDIDLIIEILLNGIIIPIILYTLFMTPSYKLLETNPILSRIISTIGAIIVPEFFLVPLQDMIYEETGSVIIAFIISIILLFVDIRIADLITRIIVPQS